MGKGRRVKTVGRKGMGRGKGERGMAKAGDKGKD